MVAVVEIEVIRGQPAQTRLECAGQMRARESCLVGAGPRRHVRLGSDHHLVAPSAQRPPHDLFGATTVVDIRGVDEVAAGVEKRGDDLLRLGFVGRGKSGAGPEVHRAQACTRDLQTRVPHVQVIHRPLPRRTSSTAGDQPASYRARSSDSVAVIAASTRAAIARSSAGICPYARPMSSAASDGGAFGVAYRTK